MGAPQFRYQLIASLVVLVGCGDDGASEDAGVVIDAINVRPDVMNGVTCPNAEPNYPGALQSPTATDDGTTLTFFGDLNTDTPPDRLRIVVADNVAEPIGTFVLPHADWSVSICVDDSDSTCATELVAFSGTLRVESVSTRFKANLDRVLFVDSQATPTCSASVSQASLDVAIGAGA